jgi:hypothetical protein
MISPVMRVFSTIVAILTFALSGVARGQQPDPGGEDFTGEQPKPQSVPTRAVQPGRGSNEVTLEVKSFGIGGVPRQGEWVGVRIAVNDSAEKVRNVMVRMSVLDSDGDTALMQRVIVTNPGTVQQVWLYLRLPFNNDFAPDITASEAIESGTPAAGESQQYVPGRLLGRQPFQVSGANMLPAYVGLLPVVGYAAGLEQYSWQEDSNKSYAITGNELTVVRPQLEMSGLPDRWQGYSGITALAFTSAATEDNPLNLRKDQADAIREYVRRGGHFVVVLPNVGQNWVGQPGNLLADILPAAKVTRSETVDLNKYRALLTSDRDVDLPKDATVQSFTPAIGDVWPNDTFPIMIGPEEDVVVLRRLVGEGMVTVIGLDITSHKLQKITHGFMADQFWNRILGKRMRTLTLAEISNGDKGKPPPGKPDDADVESYNYNVNIKEIDTGIAKAVNDEGKAAVGLMMAFFVFVAYWLIAGPVGYFLLKQRNWKQHAWVGFLAATGVFTAVAWGGANLLKRQRVDGNHLTILDGVYGQNTQRARSWIGLFLPSYGKQEVSVAPAPGTSPPGGAVGAEWHNLIATLDLPTNGGSTGWSSFPDARGYVEDARKPDTASFPSRATTKQVQVDWAGSLPEGWGMPHPIADASVPVGQEIKLVDRKDKDGKRIGWGIEGTVVHTLPNALTNVWVAVVREPVPDPRLGYPGERMRMAYNITRMKSEWNPNEPYDLSALEKSGKDSKLDTPCEYQSGFNPNAIAHTDREINPADYAFATSLMDMFRPPDYQRYSKGFSGFGSRYVYHRQTAHGFDLSRWFTQPCVIIIGEMGDENNKFECPVPIRVSGEDVRKRIKGRTIVRWVYPLAASPFRAAPPKSEETVGSGPAAGSPAETSKSDDSGASGLSPKQ